MDVLANLMAYYNNGENEAFHYALREILVHYREFNASTIYDVAEFCSSSTATISRLATQLGYKSYSDFKHNLFDAVHEYYYQNRILAGEERMGADELVDTYFDSMERTIRTVRQSIDVKMLEEITEEMHNASSVHFCSFYTQFSEIWLQINLMMGEKPTVLNQRFHEQIRDINSIEPGALVFVIAPSDNSGMDALPLLDAAREHKARSVFITNSTHSRYRDKADYFFAFDGSGTRLDMNGMEILFDLLSLIYRRKYID